MQLFDSVKMYVFMFCILSLISVEKLRQLTEEPAHTSNANFDIRNILLALITICMAGYLLGLLRKISNRIEQTAIVLIEVLCILWFADLLARFGIAWAEIPHGRYLSAAVHCAVTVLAGVRTLQVVVVARQNSTQVQSWPDE